VHYRKADFADNAPDLNRVMGGSQHVPDKRSFAWRLVYQSQADRPGFCDGNFLSEVTNTHLVFQERNFGIPSGAYRGNGLQEILIDLRLEHVDFMERCLHLGQTLGVRTPFTCRQKWQNRGAESALWVVKIGSERAAWAIFPG